ncbi:MAG TPA: glycosyltransferase family 39 protein, partial [Alphaproteobacteria bacterium]|nr:glycosyltransferase family 39 protein [Alphaproteobacteria bacterium]
ETRYKKPAGIYWMQAGLIRFAQKLGFDNAPQVIGLYRLPSLMGALLAVVLTGLIGARLLGAQQGFVAGLLMASCLLLNVEARLAKTDAALLATILCCVLVYAKAYVRSGLPKPLKFKDVLLFWIALGLGFLIKGPVILLAVVGLPLALKIMGEGFGWLAPLRPAFGLPLALLITLPWFVAIGLRSQGAFFKEAAGHDLLAKIWQGQNWGGAPPGYYVVLSWATLWPASLPVWLSLPWAWKNRRMPSLKFLLAWAIPLWVVFELVFTKLPHYVLPAYPALALLAAGWLLQMDHEGRPPQLWRRAVLAIWGTVSAFLCLVPAILPVFAESQIFFFPIFFSGLALGFALAALQLLRRDRRKFAPLPLAMAGAILAFAIFHFLFNDMPSVFVSARLAEKLSPPGNCTRTTLAIAGYSEPSLVFLAGADTKLLPRGEDVALALSADPCLTAAVSDDQLTSFKETLDGLGARADEAAEIKGFNYARGKPVDITLYTAQQ